jgi:hypothetical protein
MWRGWTAQVASLKRKAEKKADRQEKGIEEAEEGKQGNVIGKRCWGEQESKNEAKRSGHRWGKHKREENGYASELERLDGGRGWSQLCD